MFFSSPAIQGVSSAKTGHQLAAAEERLAEITSKLSKVNKLPPPPKASSPQEYDWTKSYTSWSAYEDVDELTHAKEKEEAKLDGIINQSDMLGHYHDHSKERVFFELSEEEKFKSCENSRIMGNYLYNEGVYPKAAENYQIAIAYYEYCFPEDNATQNMLDDLRRACLCNISLCYLHMGYLRQSVDSATIVLKETDGKHSKALFRRAQAYRALDEYERCVVDLQSALELSPGDEAITAELHLVKNLSMNYSRSSRQFAQSMLQQQQQQYQQTTVTSTTHVLAVGSAGQKINIEAEDNAVRQQFNPAMPLEPVMPGVIEKLNAQCTGVGIVNSI